MASFLRHLACKNMGADEVMVIQSNHLDYISSLCAKNTLFSDIVIPNSVQTKYIVYNIDFQKF